MSLTLEPPAARHGPRVDTRPAHVDTVIRYLAGVLVVASLVVVTFLWLAGGGIENLGSWADGLTSAGRWTGLLSSDLLLAQVLLMARIPSLERPLARTGWPASTGSSGSPRSRSCRPTWC